MMVGGTLLCSLRLAFATQGYAVLTWFRHNKRWYGLVGLAIIVIAVYLEFNMFVLTIVGILDIWANLRHLSRGVRTLDGVGDTRGQAGMQDILALFEQLAEVVDILADRDL